MNASPIDRVESLIAAPNHPDQSALLDVLDDWRASQMLAFRASRGSLAQIAAAMRIEWPWLIDGWNHYTKALVDIITHPRCSESERMLDTWSRGQGSVGALHDETDAMCDWYNQKPRPWSGSALASLLGPSSRAAQLILDHAWYFGGEETLPSWSMAIDPHNPTAWQHAVDSDILNALRQRFARSSAFPAWGWEEQISPRIVLDGIVGDLSTTSNPDHPSIRARVAWLETHSVFDPAYVGHYALVASIANSQVLARVVIAHITRDSKSLSKIAQWVPWDRLHPVIQTSIDATMLQASEQWQNMWDQALGQKPVDPDEIIDAGLLLWRIPKKQWEELPSDVRTFLLYHASIPDHCYGKWDHPDIVARRDCPDGRILRLWNPDIPFSTFQVWGEADIDRIPEILNPQWGKKRWNQVRSDAQESPDVNSQGDPPRRPRTH